MDYDDKFKQVIDLIADDEDLALECFVSLAHKFRWGAVVFTRKDIEKLVKDMKGITLTDDEWEEFYSHPEWKKVFQRTSGRTWADLHRFIDGPGDEGGTDAR